jgi:hypothetical protein
MTTREIVKIKNGWTVVSSAEDEASYRYANKALALRQIQIWERSEAQAIVHRAEHRAVRIGAIRRYCALRAERKAKVPVQFSFGF